jgi:GDPmannose 4,6-dehydratase
MPRGSRLELAPAPEGDEALHRLLRERRPDEIYNLASQPSPELSWRQPLETGVATGLSAHRLFEAVRGIGLASRVYQASSSEMYGDCPAPTQNEDTPFRPVNPYAVAKVYAHHMARIYRETLGVYVACGILFNHESTLRGMGYLTQRIAHGAACASRGIAESRLRNADGTPVVTGGKLLLGNLDAQRDWGSARDYVRAMWMMVQAPQAADYVIGTGKLRTVRDLCEFAYRSVGLDWREHVRSDDRLRRPADTGVRVADATRARTVLGWTPVDTIESVLEEMIAMHVAALASGQ